MFHYSWFLIGISSDIGLVCKHPHHQLNWYPPPTHIHTLPHTTCAAVPIARNNGLNNLIFETKFINDRRFKFGIVEGGDFCLHIYIKELTLMCNYLIFKAYFPRWV